MYKLHGIMRQGTIDSALTSVRYDTLEEARAGARGLSRLIRGLSILGWTRLRRQLAITDTSVGARVFVVCQRRSNAGVAGGVPASDCWRVRRVPQVTGR